MEWTKRLGDCSDGMDNAWRIRVSAGSAESLRQAQGRLRGRGITEESPHSNVAQDATLEWGTLRGSVPMFSIAGNGGPPSSYILLTEAVK
jgi:hypothetical protein